jgi:hypothetical protein
MICLFTLYIFQWQIHLLKHSNLKSINKYKTRPSFKKELTGLQNFIKTLEEDTISIVTSYKSKINSPSSPSPQFSNS